MRKERKPIQWPAWRYSPDGEGQIFNHPSEVPEGWTDNPYPQEFTPSEARLLKGNELKAALLEKGIKVDPRWPHAYMEQLNDGTATR